MESPRSHEGSDSNRLDYGPTRRPSKCFPPWRWAEFHSARGGYGRHLTLARQVPARRLELTWMPVARRGSADESDAASEYSLNRLEPDQVDAAGMSVAVEGEPVATGGEQLIASERLDLAALKVVNGHPHSAGARQD